MNRYYVGLAATLHDSALAIVDPAGEVVFAEATERPLQHKRAYNSPPDDMIRVGELVDTYCGAKAEVTAAVSWSDAFLSRLNYVSAAVSPFAPAADDELAWPLTRGAALVTSMRNSLGQAALNLAVHRPHGRALDVRYYDHHFTHAATGVWTSAFDRCAVAVLDGFGEVGASAFYRYENGDFARLTEASPDLDPEMAPAASLGHYYARLCALCGFDPIRGEEWKVMGLAAYGTFDPDAAALLRGLLTVDGLTLRPAAEPDVLRGRLRALRRWQRRPGDAPLAAADLAHTGQRVFEEIVIRILRNLHARTGCDALVFTGGCGLNSSCNGKILSRTPFTRLHVPSAPGDDGNAIGAALLAHREDHPGTRREARVTTPYLGSALAGEAIRHLRAFSGLPMRLCKPGEAPVKAAELLANGKIIGWIQGRAEFGPRALGNRSILADPRPADMKDRINARVKFREAFRPLAPSILPAYGDAYFLDYQESPYMERALRLRASVRKTVPAIVHVDGTGRLQTVRRDWNPRFHDLIAAFHARTGVPLVLNTSYNVMGKPIAHAVEDVLGAFFTTGLDAVFLGDVLLEKPGTSEPPPAGRRAMNPARSSSPTSSATRPRTRLGGSRSSAAGTARPRRAR